MKPVLKNKKILLIIGGGISAYKILDLIRLIKKDGASIKTVLTRGGKKFVTPLSVAALSQNKVLEDMFDSNNEGEMDHISLSRWCDIVLFAPTTANTIADLASGKANDLATTLVLASDKDIVLVPAMNIRMWLHKSTQRNFSKLKDYGYLNIGPTKGSMACGEYGEGRMSNVEEIYNFLINYFQEKNIVKKKKLKAIVTAGPTKEFIDPVRFISNNSSGKQGYEIARSLAKFGVITTLISGPSNLRNPENVKVIRVTTAKEMMKETKKNLPVDIAVCSAAVSDFKVKNYKDEKIKKFDRDFFNLSLEKTDDILEYLSKNNLQKPKLVIGFAAETKNIIKFAREKKIRKHCDWMIANDVSKSDAGFNSDYNSVSIIYDDNKIERIEKNTKTFIADKISRKIIDNFI